MKTVLAFLVLFCAPSFLSAADFCPGPLPTPISNNAVAGFSHDGVLYVMSFMGLAEGKTHSDISSEAWLWTSQSREWEAFPDVPVEQGRLASIAVGIYDRILLFGGYTVADDGSEVSTPEVFIVDPVSKTYKRRADMPVPVDDTVALVHANRYIYLVSGWHDHGNVNDVQVYDSWNDTWMNATPFPGVPVFGHSGGIADEEFVIVGGVGVLGEVDGKRQFGAIDQAWKAVIDSNDPTKIEWRELDAFEGTDRYRMAAAGVPFEKTIFFAGGTSRPYNFNGIGYDGIPAEPVSAVFAYDLSSESWLSRSQPRTPATMDHRGLIQCGTRLITIGGMGSGQRVLSNTVGFDIFENTKSE